jgi:hypothetical protein
MGMVQLLFHINKTRIFGSLMIAATLMAQEYQIN